LAELICKYFEQQVAGGIDNMSIVYIINSSRRYRYVDIVNISRPSRYKIFITGIDKSLRIEWGWDDEPTTGGPTLGYGNEIIYFINYICII